MNTGYKNPIHKTKCNQFFYWIRYSVHANWTLPKEKNTKHKHITNDKKKTRRNKVFIVFLALFLVQFLLLLPHGWVIRFSVIFHISPHRRCVFIFGIGRIQTENSKNEFELNKSGFARNQLLFEYIAFSDYPNWVQTKDSQTMSYSYNKSCDKFRERKTNRSSNNNKMQYQIIGCNNHPLKRKSRLYDEHQEIASTHNQNRKTMRNMEQHWKKIIKKSFFRQPHTIVILSIIRNSFEKYAVEHFAVFMRAYITFHFVSIPFNAHTKLWVFDVYE